VLTEEAIRNGMSTIKVKVGGNDTNDSDLARVGAIREVLDAHGVTGEIRIDVNASWTTEQAIEYLPSLDHVAGGLEYVEQPCATFDELRALKSAMKTWAQPVRIAVDEGIRQASSLDVTSIREVADVVIIKSLPLGGVSRSLEIIDAIGLPVIVSGSLDTSVGLASGIQLAACVPGLAGACGLGTGTLFAQDVVAKPLIPTNGTLPVGRVGPELELVRAAEPSREIVADWRARIVRAWEASARELVSDQVREAVAR
jgi:O-succinylbenzoate synthase